MLIGCDLKDNVGDLFMMLTPILMMITIELIIYGILRMMQGKISLMMMIIG